MYVQVRKTCRGLALQAIDVPELGCIGVPVQDVVDPQARAPVRCEGKFRICVPLPVAATLHLVVRRKGFPAEIAVFQCAAPTTEIFYITLNEPVAKGAFGK